VKRADFVAVARGGRYNEKKSHMENQPPVKKEWLLPVSIVIAALLIGGAIIWSTGKKAELAANPGEATDAELAKLAEKVLPVTDADHIWGDRNAPVKIVTFTDLECPYCQQFHGTIRQALAEYDGRVAFIYRNLPLTMIHPGAQEKAESAECVAEIGGNEKYWDFVGKIFDMSSEQAVDVSKLPEIAAGVGVDKAAFSACVSSGKFADKIDAESKEAQEAGGQGTPYSIIISKEGKRYPVPGAYPYESTGPGVPSFKSMIEDALAEK
jgi:protein-disulfide isomerase